VEQPRAEFERDSEPLNWNRCLLDGRTHCMLALVAWALSGSQSNPSIQVRWVDDAPRAALSILRKEAAHQPVSEGDWGALFESEGYRRLKDRENGMKRPFTDDDFRMFLSTDSLIRKADSLQRTLDGWSKLDVEYLGRRSLKYLPAQAKLKANVYPLIKPRTNSFVWDTDKDPAIMLYLDPAESPKRFAKTVVHELHHIGYASCCPSPEFQTWVHDQSNVRQQAWIWVGAFGEGYAVLAAAEGPRSDPMAAFEPNVKAAWTHGMNHLAEDMETLTAFFTDSLTGKLSSDGVQTKAMEFYSVQGPWYTVGYIQATTIERAFGHEKLMACYLDPRLLMPTYNAAVAQLPKGAKLPTWPENLIELLGKA